MSKNRTLVVLVMGMLVSFQLAGWMLAQSVTATTSVKGGPIAVAVNPITHEAYVASSAGEYKCTPFGPPCYPYSQTVATALNSPTDSATILWQSALGISAEGDQKGTISLNPVTNQVYVGSTHGDDAVIDGVSGAVTLMRFPATAIAVNPITNTIYMPDNNGQNGIAVLDGATNAMTTVVDPSAVSPLAIDINPITNKVYVANNGSANLTVIDGATNTITTTISAGSSPFAVAVNPMTNKIYVVNNTANGTVTVIDGVSNATTTISVGSSPFAIGVNPVTNKIYVANDGSNNITVIDGATNATTTLVDSTALNPQGVAVDALTNQIYVANNGSATVTVIDGATNALTTALCPGATGDSYALSATPSSPIAVDPVSNTVYVTHFTSSNVSAIAGVAGTGPPDFALAATSTNLTLRPGAQATDTIIVAPPFGNTIDLSCSVTGSAPTPSCQLSATSVTPGATYGTASLTITAPTAAAMLEPTIHPALRGWQYAVLLPFLFGIVVAAGSRTHRQHWPLCGSLLLLLLQIACGGGDTGSGSTGRGTSFPANYTVTIAGMSGAIQHTTQVTVTVQ